MHHFPTFITVLSTLILPITCLAQAPNDFISTGPGGGGYTYVPSISPYDPDLVYLNCDMGGVYRSVDGAASWQLQPYQMMVSQVKGKVQFTSDSNVLYVCRRSTTNLNDPLYRGELAKSSDGGQTWQPVPDPTSTGVHRLEVDPNSTQRLILNEYDRLFFSKDGGATWAQVYQPPSGNMWLGGVYWDGAKIFVGTNEGLLVSKDNGASFAIENHSGLPTGAGIYHLVGSKSGTTVRLFCIAAPAIELFAWSEPLILRDKLQGIYKMDYATGSPWSNTRGNIPSSEEIAWVDLANNNIQTVWAAAATADGTPKVYKSTNGGNTWSNTYLLDNNQNLSTGWAGHEGAFWLYFNDTALGLEVAPSDPNRVIIADGTGHITTDGGTTWRATYVEPASQNAPGQPSNPNLFYRTSGLDVTTAHHIYWQSDSAMFVCNTDIGQTYSADAGQTWTFAHNLFHDYGHLSNNNWYRIVRQPTTGHLFAALAELNDMYMPQRITDEVLDGTGGLVAKSTDGGMTWDTAYNFGHPVVWLEVDRQNPAKLYASVVHSVEGGVYQSMDGGVSWVKLPPPPRTQGHPYNLVSLNDGSLVATYAARAEVDGTFLTETSGVFLLPPGGNAWLDRTADAMKFYTKDLVVDPHDPDQNTWYATVWGRFTTFAGPNNQGNGGLYRTTDRGQTWSRVFANELAESIAIHPEKPGTAFLCAENDGLYFTENLGSSPNFGRVEAFPFWRPKRAFFHPTKPDEIWLTTMGGGIWRGNYQASGVVDYTPSTEDFPNPERGFYHYTETSSANHVPLDLAELQGWRDLHQPFGANYSIYSTLAFRYFVLDDFTNSPISQGFLADIAEDFAIARQAGVKLIPRFVYTVEGEDCGGEYCTPYGDAPKSLVLQHIAQLKPILQANADVIAAMQFGFVGIWGEGYYTDYFGDASQSPFGLTAQNWADRNEVLTALLDALPSSRCLQVRYPQQKQKLVYGVNAPVTAAPLSEAEAFQNTALARIGHHNDCFLSSANDIGTYENYDVGASGPDTLHLKPYMSADSRYVPVGGETCSDWNPYSNCNEQPGGGAQSEMARMHWSYLNADYNHALNNDWVNGGCIEEIKQRLGYRLELQQGEYPTDAQPGQSVSFRITLKNKGFAAPYNARTVRLLLRNVASGETWQVELPDDPRTWLAGDQAHVMEHTFCLPNDIPLGNYEILLHLADPYPSLAARPEYAIRLANEGVWEESTGYNKLLHQIQINSSANNASCFGETCFQPSDLLAPEVDFVANLQSGCAPLTVAFSTELQACQTYEWNFPGGSPANSNLTNLTVVYDAPGSYPVELTVANNAGATTLTEPGFIQVQGLPTPAFSFTSNYMLVSFQNQSENAFSYAWNFGEDDDGYPQWSTLENPSFLYLEPGVHEVTLVAYNACGSQTISQTITVSCPPYTGGISPNGSLAICPGDTLQLTATSGYGSYLWHVNGQAIPGSNSKNYLVTESGDYSVVVTSSPFCSATSPSVAVSELPLATPAFAVSVNGLIASFSNSSIDATAYTWDFGDPNAGVDNSSSLAAPVHQFTSPGSYVVVLTASNDCGSASLSQVVNIGCTPPLVELTLDGPNIFCAGDSTLLIATPGFQTYQWWLNGQELTNANGANLAATLAGSYQVFATDAFGCMGSSNLVALDEFPAPDATIDYSLNGTLVSLVATGNNVSNYSWFLGNGQTATGPTASFDTGIYGNYEVSLVIDNPCYTDTLSLTIANPPPPLNVVLSAMGATTVCAGESVLLDVEGDGFLFCDWYLDGALIMDAPLSDQYEAMASGDYTAVCALANGQAGLSNEVTVFVQPLPQVELGGLANSYEDDDPAVSLEGTPLGGAFSGNGVVGNQFDPALAGVGEHWVSYAFTDSLGCTGADSMMVSVLLGTAVTSLEGLTDLRVVPNPNSGRFRLELDLAAPKWLEIRLLNLVGQVLDERQTGLPAGHSSMLFDFPGLAQGVYFLKVIDERGLCATVSVILTK